MRQRQLEEARLVLNLRRTGATVLEVDPESFRFRHSTLAAKTRIKARESARRGGLAGPALLEVDAADAVDEESKVDEPF